MNPAAIDQRILELCELLEEQALKCCKWMIDRLTSVASWFLDEVTRHEDNYVGGIRWHRPHGSANGWWE